MLNDTISTLIRNLNDEQSLAIKELIHQVADFDSNLLIYGETGVGKDFWANYLSAVSSYSTILNLNCGDVPPNLLESEWFGYKRGAFTGADRDFEGKWSKATGGILFLNQIDLLDLNLQARLLRIIERKKFFPLGSVEEQDINVRFVFSADDDIEQKVREGTFRADLFYRISTHKVRIPPLRERKKDIIPLLRYFAKSKQIDFTLGEDDLELLRLYPWRGNIRELENFITSVAIKKKQLTHDDIQLLLKNSTDFLESIINRDITLEELEQKYITFLLQKYRNKVKVANILGISRKSLYNKLK